jgi:hypothetical protein
MVKLNCFTCICDRYRMRDNRWRYLGKRIIIEKTWYEKIRSKIPKKDYQKIEKGSVFYFLHGLKCSNF